MDEWITKMQHIHTVEYYSPLKKKEIGGRSQDGGGIGRGDHFLFYEFIKRITERRANFTKQLLIAS